QKGWVPLSHEALLRAIDLNGAAVEMNRAAFNWGRLAAHDLKQVLVAAGLVQEAPLALDPTSLTLQDDVLSPSLDARIARRAAFLTDYQNAAYAQQYQDLVAKVRAAEAQKAPGFTALTEAVARYAFKLMAYKDEYEVARLYTSGEFERRVKEQFDGDYRLHFHLAPPLLARKDAEGRLKKAEYGAWVFGAFKLLAKLRGLRGTALDVFGYTAERRMERQLIADYRASVDELLATLDHDNHALAVEIASVPEHIRGYGHVKHAHLETARAKWDELLALWRRPAAARQAA
ncbi:MAG TPA: indolepyruvate ferredoxin oxidoreductase family protein, partial [Rhodanobacteraceae bacterium]|nr:indolepyruvate ferredoxin oxidoreductase family protein [Rhodanobacteraceae bacterium]